MIFFSSRRNSGLFSSPTSSSTLRSCSRRELQGDAAAVGGGRPALDQAVALQPLDQRRHRRFVARDAAPELDLGQPRIEPDDHQRREVPRPEIALPRILDEDLQGGILRQPQVERDQVAQRPEIDLVALDGRTRRPAGLVAAHVLIPPSTISMQPVVKLLWSDAR
jgi:hypothetical protein